MSENNCADILKPGEHCKFGGRFELLEKRVEDLEREQNEEAEFRKLYYQDREARIRRDAEIDFQMKAMDGKLDTMMKQLEELAAWRAEQDNRPNKLLDSIRDKLIGAVLGAVGAGIVAGIIYLIRGVGRV